MILDAYGRTLTPEQLEPPRERWRQDGWENLATGIGTAADKTQMGRFFPVWRVLDVELKDLYNGSDLAAMAVEEPVKESFREGFDLAGHNVVTSKSGKVGHGASVLDSDVKALRDYATHELELEEQFVEAGIWGNLFGGCLLVMGIDDGRFPWEPVDEENIQSIDYLSLVDRRYAYVQSQYSGMDRKRYGKAEIYLISNAVAGSGWNDHGVVRARSASELRGAGASIQLVHESRVIRFDGNPADVVTRQRLAGWSWSILQRTYNAMRQFEHAFDSVGYLVSDASQGIFKLHGLIKAIASGQQQALTRRLELLDHSRSVARAIALDAGGPDGKNSEDFTRVPTPFGGVADVLDRMMMRFAAAARMPQTKLFGRAPAGMNATGESDTRGWYDALRTKANTKTSPQLARVFRLLALAKEGPIGGKKVDWTVDFRPLWSPTDKEVADTQFARAQKDQLYNEMGAIPSEVIALGLKDQYPALDTDAIEDALEAKTSFDPYANDPDPPVPPQAPGEPLSPVTPVQTIGPSAGPQVEGAAPTGAPAPAVRQTPPKGAPASNGKLVVGKPTKGPQGDAADRQDAAVLDLLEARADGGAARAVFQQLLADYPAGSLGWVLAAHWTGPVEIPLDQVDFSNRNSWKASHDGHVAKHVAAIEAGESPPAILVQPPDNAKAIVVDGHHRTLASEQLGRPVLAYVAEVHVARGPWDELHSMQKRGSSRGSVSVAPSWRSANRDDGAGGWYPRDEHGGRFAQAEHSEVVQTPHGEAHVQLRVLTGGDHVFTARARDASGKTLPPMTVRLPATQVSPERLEAEADGKRAMAYGRALEGPVRAQAHALAHAMGRRAAGIRAADAATDAKEPPARGDGDADRERVPAGQPGGGEFASSGGGAGGGGAPRTTGKRTWTDELPSGMRDETWKAHYDKHPDQGGKPSAERAALHEAILHEALRPEPAKPGEQKIAIMVMGAPGSGKSTLLQHDDTSKFVKVDSDAIRAKLPEYQRATADRAATYRYATHMTEAETSDIAGQMMSRAMTNGQHLIVESPGANGVHVEREIKALQAAGYHVDLRMVHVDEQAAAARAKKRAEATGREVPKDFQRLAPKAITKNFEPLARQADEFHLVDNSGKKSRQVWSGKKGQPDTIHDQPFVDAFRARAARRDADEGVVG